MVWFQCEDCGEDLKKPKLPNHFRICSASKLSCIDCGQTFGQQSVQGHNQCISEAEKYGPKGQGKVSNGTPGKPNKGSNQKPDVDINVGLSNCPPWFCSLCKTQATSKQTLLLHAEGKKHRGKARGYHASQQPKQAEEPASDAKTPAENASDGDLQVAKSIEKAKMEDTPKPLASHVSSDTTNGDLPSNKKRKLDASDDASNGEVIQVEKVEGEGKRKIKWKKLITSTLNTNPDGVLKMRKLRKLVLKSVQESGIKEDESELSKKFEHEIDSSSKFSVDGKYVRLAAKV